MLQLERNLDSLVSSDSEAGREQQRLNMQRFWGDAHVFW